MWSGQEPLRCPLYFIFMNTGLAQCRHTRNDRGGYRTWSPSLSLPQPRNWWVWWRMTWVHVSTPMHVTSWLSTLPTTYPLKIGACDLIFVCVFQLVTFPRSFQNKVLPPRETQLGSDDKPNWLVERLWNTLGSSGNKTMKKTNYWTTKVTWRIHLVSYCGPTLRERPTHLGAFGSLYTSWIRHLFLGIPTNYVFQYEL